MRNRNSYIFLTAIGIFTVFTIFIYQLRIRLANIKTEIFSQVGSNEVNAGKRLMIESLFDRLSKLDTELASAKEIIEQDQTAESYQLSSYNSEQATPVDYIEEWLDRSDRLGRFLELNNRFRIPEMSRLTPHDWLVVTEKGPLESEADYRICLSKLRQLANERQISDIMKAWKAYDKQSNGRPLSDFKDLAKYSDGENKAKALKFFRLATTEEKSAMRGISKIDQVAIWADKPIDEIWDRTIIISKESGNIRPSTGDRLKGIVENALTKFESEHGRIATSSEELTSFVAIDKDQFEISAIFKALTTIPDLN